MKLKAFYFFLIFIICEVVHGQSDGFFYKLPQTDSVYNSINYHLLVPDGVIYIFNQYDIHDDQGHNSGAYLMKMNYQSEEKVKIRIGSDH